MTDKDFYKRLNSTSSSLFDLALGHESKDERYTEMEVLGSGATKIIKKVLDLSSGRAVAQAVPGKNLSKEQIIGFLEEARLNASLQHPNIIPVYNLGYQRDGQPFFTMKLCSEKKLSEILESKNCELFELIGIFLKVCEAMNYAHSLGAIHRDIKDDNILLGDFGEVMICDWGSAQVLKGSLLDQEIGKMTQPISKGTPGFMSPEQEQGAEPEIVQDIYSLGALLYKILNGNLPEKNYLYEFASSSPTSLQAICLKALSENPNDRYNNCADFGKDIKAFLGGFVPKAEEASITKHIGLFFRRHKTLSLSVALFLLTTVIISVFYIQSLRSKEQQTALQRDRAEEALKLYDIEKSSREKIAKIGADYFINEADRFVSLHTSTLALEVLGSIPKEGLKKSQKRSISAIYGRIYFYRQQFSKATEYLKKGEVEKSEGLLEIAKDFYKIKKDDTKMLDTQQTIEIIKRLQAIELHQAHCFFREQVLRIPNFEEQLPIIKQMILFNNRIDDLNINLTIKGNEYIMDLSNNKNMRRWEPIRQMPLTKINFSNSPIRNSFYILESMPLEEINITNCRLKSFEFVDTVSTLKRIICDSKTKSLLKKKNIPDRIEIIVDEQIISDVN